MSAGRERVCVREVIWDGCRVEWPGLGRPHRKRLAVVEKYDGAARLEVERRRLVVELAGAAFCEWSVVAVEADRMRLDVEVADVIVEARAVDEALEVLEP